MTRTRTLGAALLLCAAAASRPAVQAQAPQPQPSPGMSFPTAVDVVTVDVIVLDKKGQPVEGLRREDFVVKEEGKPQAITSFETVTVSESAPTPSRTRVSTNVLPPGARPGRSFVVLFDDMNITTLSTGRARRAVTEFIKALRPGDELMVVPTSGGAWWTGDLPRDRESLLAYVNRLEGGYRPDTGPDRIWDHEAQRIWLGRDPKVLAYVARRWFENNLLPEAYPTDREVRAEVDVSPGLALIRAKSQQVYSAAQRRLRATLDTITRVSESLRAARGRKDLFLVSEGFIMDPDTPEFREAMQAARLSNVVVNFIDAGSAEGALGQAGMPGGSAEFGRDVEEQDTTTVHALAVQATQGSRSVAYDTGGRVVPATGGAGDVMGKIAEESRAHYLLGFVSSDTRRDGKFRKLSVVVSRPDVEVRARRGYYAPREGEQRRPEPDKLDPQVRTALDAPAAAGGLPLRLVSYVFGAAAEGKTGVLLVAEADLAPLALKPAAGKVQTALETFVVVHGRDSGQVSKEEKLVELDVPEQHWEAVVRAGLPIRREFQLAPGAYQARLLVRDRKTGRLGTVRHEFTVPPATGLRTSTPIVTDVFTGAPGELPRPVPVAHRTFKAGGRVAVAYDVFGAAPDARSGGPRVTAGYAVRKADGATVSGSDARPLNPAGLGRLSQVIVFNAPAEAGEYEVVLQVNDEAGGTRTEVVEPFTVG